MRNNSKVISLLNDTIRSQLSIINQYLVHARLYQYLNLAKLYACEKNELIDRTARIDGLVERVLTLGGRPDLYGDINPRLGDHALQTLRCDLLIERQGFQRLRRAIIACSKTEDRESCEQLLRLYDEVEEQIDWLESQLELCAKVGTANYLRMQMSRSILKSLVPSQSQPVYQPLFNVTSSMMGMA